MFHGGIMWNGETGLKKMKIYSESCTYNFDSVTFDMEHSANILSIVQNLKVHTIYKILLRGPKQVIVY
jgi:hypothetical protein